MEICKTLAIKGSAFKEWWRARNDVRRISINIDNDLIRIDDLKDDSFYIIDRNEKREIEISEIDFANSKDEIVDWFANA